MLRRSLVLSAIVLAATSFGSGPRALLAQAPAMASAPNDYSDMTNWLCRPGRQDACALDLATTIVRPDGETTIEPWSADPNAPIDCFYVYPTVSNDPTANSDMEAGQGETGVVRSQLARFASKCRVFAPMYRQVTLAALRARLSGSPMEDDADLAYTDVADAWNHYLTNDNNGRGVVLMGHSQGTGVLVRMIAEEIDGKPIQDQLVSALLIGNNVEVPQGKDVGGSFQHLPLCRSAGQIGCAVTYMTFRSTLPPAQSFFARSPRPGMITGCTNPAALEGGAGELQAYFGGGGFGGEPMTWVEPAVEVSTEFVTPPGLVQGECVQKNGYSYLEVVVSGNPNDPRADDIPGDLVIGGQASAVWGLHLIDVGIAMGNLLEIVDQQTKAYLGR